MPFVQSNLVQWSINPMTGTVLPSGVSSLWTYYSEFDSLATITGNAYFNPNAMFLGAPDGASFFRVHDLIWVIASDVSSWISVIQIFPIVETIAVNSVPSLTTNGELLIGNTGGAPIAATLTAGAGITITNGHGSISIASTVTGVSPGIGLQFIADNYPLLFPGAAVSNVIGNTQTVAGDATEFSTLVNYMPFYIPNNYTVDNVYINVTAAHAASSINIGLYHSAALNTGPTGAAINVINIPTTSTGEQLVAWGQPLLANTMYWAGVQFSTATTLALTALTINPLINYGPGNSYITSNTTPMPSNLWAQANAFSAGVMPAASALNALTLSSIINFPMISFL